jgi:hypothetical protein
LNWQHDPPSFNKAGIFLGLWLSLVERAVRVGEVQGSNPCSPMFFPCLESAAVGPWGKDPIAAST